jgi:hypothetical protein
MYDDRAAVGWDISFRCSALAEVADGVLVDLELAEDDLIDRASL